jgi:hypothetical protein
MKTCCLLLVSAFLLSACAGEPRTTASGRKLELVRIDHGMRRTPTYAYRPAER